MRYAAYPAYKPSGIDWLAQIPQHWAVGRMRWLADLYAGGTPDKTNDSYWEDGTIPWLNSGAVNQELVTEPSAYVSELGYANSSARWVPKDALVIALAGQGKTKGMVAQLAIDATCNQSMAAIVPRAVLAPRFLFWWLASQYSTMRNLAGGEARDGLNLDIVGALPCPMPPLSEQRAIADFLDGQTARIDALVAKKRKLIGKLKEKRAALISRTVTRGLPPEAASAAGLDPHPRVKPSGVEWISDVPERWETRRLRDISDEVTVGVVVNPSSYVSDEGVPFLLGGDIDEFRIDLDACKRCPAEVSDGPLRKSRLWAGDVVVVRVGYPGVAAVVPDAAEGGNCASMMIVRQHRRFVSEWLAYIFNSQIGHDQVDIVQYGAAQKQFNIGHAVDFTFPFPPVDEQHAIVEFLDRHVASLEKLVTKTEQVIERLQEYRTALITAAVTGKIDLRGTVTQVDTDVSEAAA